MARATDPWSLTLSPAISLVAETVPRTPRSQSPPSKHVNHTATTLLAEGFMNEIGVLLASSTQIKGSQQTMSEIGC